MYNLLVSHEVGGRAQGTFAFASGRFLEYTIDLIKVQLQALSLEAIECIRSWPCVLMQEGRGDEAAHVARVTAVEEADREIKLIVESLSCDPPLVNDALWKVRAELDIEQFEFSRNHWAIKDRDLFSVLRAAGHAFEESAVGGFENRPLPAPPRSALVAARKVIAEWGHTDIDDFLLEAGVAGLQAGRDHGTRRDRANAIVGFSLENPAITTAENSLLSAFIVKAASPGTHDSEPGPAPTRAPAPVADTREAEAQESSARSPNRVFVVHGQNDSARDAVVAFLSSVSLEGIVLHDQPNMGRHLLTKFIEEAELVTFAIVLMTDDDVGALSGDDLEPRARQNVILELGYFLSHLGQQRVCALITPGLETPSDFDGIVYIRMDADEHWKVELERELRAARMPLAEPSAADQPPSDRSN